MTEYWPNGVRKLTSDELERAWQIARDWFDGKGFPERMTDTETDLPRTPRQALLDVLSEIMVSSEADVLPDLTDRVIEGIAMRGYIVTEMPNDHG